MTWLANAIPGEAAVNSRDIGFKKRLSLGEHGKRERSWSQGVHTRLDAMGLVLPPFAIASSCKQPLDNPISLHK